MAPLILTIVRHGESTDNLKNLYAGWKDAPLSNHGMNQAKAVGAYFADIPITAVYASPLLRARWTGEQIQSQNKTSPPPPITFSPLLREQHFGQLEGISWDNGKGFVREHRRTFAFPDGESLDDVARRADEAINTFLVPHILAAHSLETQHHVVVAAHGIFNAELIGAFLRRRSTGAGTGWKSTGMTNTGWTRLSISLSDPSHPHSTFHPSTIPSNTSTNPSSIPLSPAPTLPSPHPGQPLLEVEVILVNQCSHLDGIRRQLGGIGSAGFDKKQVDLRDFFSGGGRK
ncbi:histidine phosphatase superfamily [Mrakia frigida]|uniref:histidine phosphatase family protein n=1 Tax=Mrakia frigida TaxID=29902 RepID=UPI003FCC04AC